MPQPAALPADYAELVDQYDPLVRWVISRTAKISRPYARYRLSREDAEDLRQHVYTVMLHRDYLARCRAYLEQHSGSLSTSLYAFVQRVSMNWFRDQRVRRGYELRSTADLKIVRSASGPHSTDPPHQYDIVDTRDAFAGIEAGIMLDELAAQLQDAPREVLRACQLEGEVTGRAITAQLPHRRPKTALRGLRRAVKEIHGPQSGV